MFKEHYVNMFSGYRAGAIVLIQSEYSSRFVWRYGTVTRDTGPYSDIVLYTQEGLQSYTTVHNQDILMGFRDNETIVYRADLKNNTEEIESMAELLDKYHIDVKCTTENFARCDIEGGLLLPYSQIHTQNKKKREGLKRKAIPPTKESMKMLRKLYKAEVHEEAVHALLSGSRALVYRLAIDTSYTALCNLINIRYQEGKTPPIKKDWQTFFYDQTPYFRDAWIKRACEFLQLPWWKHTEIAHLWDHMLRSESVAYNKYLQGRAK